MSSSRYEIVDEQPPPPQAAASSQWEIVPEQQHMDMNISLPQKIARAAGIGLSDVAGLPASVLQSIASRLNSSTTEIPGAAKQVFTDPERVGENLTKGVASLGKGIINTPGDAFGYLGHLGLLDPQYMDASKIKVDQLPGESYLDKLLGSTRPGDALLQQTPGAIAGYKPALKVTKATGSGISKVFSKITGNEGYEQSARDLGLPEKNQDVMTLKKQILDAEQEHRESKDILDSAKDRAKDSNIPTDPVIAERSLRESQDELDRLKQETDAHNFQMDNLRNKPEIPAPNQEPHVELAHATGLRQSAENNLTDLIDHHEKIQGLDNDLDSKIEGILKPGSSHDQDMASMILPKEAANRAEIGGMYKELENNMAGKTIDIDHKDELDKTNEAFTNLIKSGGMHSNEALTLNNKIHELTNAENPSAKDYLVAYRTARDYARDAAKKSYQPGMKADERAEWQARNKELSQTVDDMGKKLEEALGDEDSQKLREANSRWRNEVAPLHYNPVFQQMKKHVRMGKNVIDTIRGREPGNMILQNYIKSDPEIAAHAIGQRYDASSKGNEVLKPNDEMKKYISAHPELENLLSQKSDTRNILDDTKQNIEAAKDQHKAALSQEKEAIKNAKDAMNEHERNVADFHREMNSREREQNALQSTMTKHLNDVTRLESHVEKLKNELPTLKKAYNDEKKVSKKKFVLGSQLKAKQLEIQEAQRQLQKAKYFLPRAKQALMNFVKRKITKGL